MDASEPIISLDAAALADAVKKAEETTPKPAKRKRKSRAKPKEEPAPAPAPAPRASLPAEAAGLSDPEQRKMKLIELMQKMAADDPALALPDVRMDDALLTVERHYATMQQAYAQRKALGTLSNLVCTGIFGLEKAAASVPEVHTRLNLSGWTASVQAQRQELESILKEMVTPDIVALASPEVRLAVLLLGSAATTAAQNASQPEPQRSENEADGDFQQV